MDLVEFALQRGGDDLVAQVAALGSAVEHSQCHAAPIPEVARHVVDHIGLGRCRQTENGWNGLGSGTFPDVAAGIAIVRPEVMSPF